MSEEEIATGKQKKSKKDGAIDELKGPPLNAETVAYFKGIEDALKDSTTNSSDESGEDRQILISNVYPEIKGKEYRLSVNKRFSSLLETIIPISTSTQVRRFWGNLKGTYYDLFTDRHASHVLQRVLQRLPAMVLEQHAVEAAEEDGEQGAPPSSAVEIFSAMCKELKPRWGELFRNAHASFLIRDIIHLCSGLPLAQGDKKHGGAGGGGGADLSLDQRTQVSKALSGGDTVRAISGNVVSMAAADLKFMVVDQSASGVLQALARAMGHQVRLLSIGGQTGAAKEAEDGYETFLVKLLLWSKNEGGKEEVEGKGKIPMKWKAEGVSVKHVAYVMMDRSGSHFIESVLDSAPPRLFDTLLHLHFLGQMRSLCSHPVANFCVQHLFTNLTDKGQVKALVRELFSEAVPSDQDSQDGSKAAPKQPPKQQQQQGQAGGGKGQEASVLAALVRPDRLGLLWRFAQACQRLRTQEMNLLNQLCHILSTAPDNKDATTYLPSSSAFVKYFLYPTGQQQQQQQQADNTHAHAHPHVHRMGSAVLQTLLNLHPRRSVLVIKSFLLLSAQEIAGLAKDEVGSRVIEALLTSGSPSPNPTPESNAHNEASFIRPQTQAPAVASSPEVQTLKMQLVDKLKGQFADLCTKKYGSFVVEKCFAVSGMTLKTHIAKELVAAESRLATTLAGQTAIRKCKLAQFKRSQAAWENDLKSQERKQKLFEDFLDLAPSNIDKKKKKQKNQGKREREQEQEPQLQAQPAATNPSSKKQKQAGGAGGGAVGVGAAGSGKPKRQESSGQGKKPSLKELTEEVSRGAAELKVEVDAAKSTVGKKEKRKQAAK